MKKSEDRADVGEAIGYFAVAALIRSMSVIVRYKYLKRKSKLEQSLTDRLKEITGRKRLKVYILPHKDIIEAFAAPTGEIFISTALYKILSAEECLGVAVHEAGHVIYQSQLCGELCSGTLFCSLQDKMGVAPLLLVSYLGNFGSAALHERLADSYAVKKGYGKQLASALATIEKESSPISFSIKDTPAYCRSKLDEFLKIHPEIKSRINKLNKQGVPEYVALAVPGQENM